MRTIVAGVTAAILLGVGGFALMSDSDQGRTAAKPAAAESNAQAVVDASVAPASAAVQADAGTAVGGQGVAKAGKAAKRAASDKRAAASQKQRQAAGSAGEKQPQPKADCTLIVKAVPEGAKVTLQGRRIGTAPLQQKGLDCGRAYRLTVRAAGYRRRTQSFEFKHNKVLIKNVQLARLPKIKPKKEPPPSNPISTDPPVKLMIGTPGLRAQVRVDGKGVGPTPVVARAPLLSPGRHIVDLVVDGRTYSYTVTVPKAAKAQRLIIRKLGQPVGGAVKAVPR